jgi:hypothetical protein
MSLHEPPSGITFPRDRGGEHFLECGQSYRLQQETVETRFLCNAQGIRARAAGHGHE